VAKRKGKRAAAAPKAAKPVKSAAGRADNSGDVILGGVNLAEVRRLIRLVQRTGIGELEVSSSGRTVRISSASGTPAAAAGSHLAAPSSDANTSAGGSGTAAVPVRTPAPENHVAITSPMVGTFYRAPAPDADPYIEVGDMVEVGQTVCIVEAMKLMNEIESEVRGRLVKILVENAQPVEFGQRLFLVEPV
jgi:oxaloacetate decarboxylase (Na+ extruding) subunit alpha